MIWLGYSADRASMDPEWLSFGGTDDCPYFEASSPVCCITPSPVSPTASVSQARRVFPLCANIVHH